MLDDEKTLSATATSKEPSTHQSDNSQTADFDEKQREDARHANPTGYSQSLSSGVSIERAEHDFAELQRELTGMSHKSKRSRRASLARIVSRKSNKEVITIDDVERTYTQGEKDQEQFDLEATLRGDVEAEERAGMRKKRLGVLWDGLTVKGFGGSDNYAKVFPDAFTDFFNIWANGKALLGLQKTGPTVDILKDFRGVTRPGEMVLVLGRPGSGCTTFLKVIANQRFGYTDVEGDVRYGPFDSKTFADKYRGEAAYNQEDDVHHPTLTVGQTLDFALETKIPGKIPEGISKKEFKEKVITTLLKMFAIQHTRNTVVGNANIRGVSGGERKRVSIAEMMVTGATLCSWDNSTRGLDASTALDYAKSLRVLSDIKQQTTFVSLYQASENIYKLFDKVMVIDSGRMVYFGPTTTARAYFEGLGFAKRPRQTTPDYLTGCTDEFERDYAEGRGPHNSPYDAETLAKAFNESSIAADLDAEMAKYRQELMEERKSHEDFRVAVHESKRKASHKSVYSVPFYLQVWALIQRQFLIKWQDKFQLVVSWLTSIIIGILIGTVWLDLPKTSAGAFTRGGVLFISFLYNAFNAFGELPATMLGRGIVNKHKSYTFHRPSALWIAQIIVDLAFTMAEIFVFSLIVYFLTNLARDAGAFFTFYLIIVTGYLCMTLFFRTLGCCCPDFDYAVKFAVIILTFLVLTTGYMINYDSQYDWMKWIFYINPLGLGFSALMNNEFNRVDLTCEGVSLIPNGPGYDNLDNQVCTLRGSEPGNPIVSGKQYLLDSFQYAPNDLWRNFGILMALIVAFLIANVMAGEYFTFGAGGNAAKTFVKPNKERDELNKALIEKRNKRREHKTEDEGSDLSIASKAILTWEGLNYDVPVPAGQLRLLNNIYGYVKPGELTALMGASGAGKTTLLDVLASRKNIGVISGDVLVDGMPKGTAFQRGTSYAEQQDVHEPMQTVREALRFSADLRQPLSVPQEEKYAYVEEILSLLEMEDMADAIIGDPESGLAVEQRKRVTIGVELAAKPELLLFLDEPTSGLDSQSAYNIVRFLRKLANAGQAILCTIHQPGANLFQSFDRLLLLQRGGRCVYFGDIGEDATTLIDYFHRHGADFPADANPAEAMLEAIGAGQAPRVGDRDWADIWADSPELANVKDRIQRMKEERLKAVGDAPKVEATEYATPLWHQLKTVQKRTNLAFWRSPNYGFTRLWNHVIIGLVTGLTFLNLDNSRIGMQQRIFVIFQVTVLPAIIVSQVEPKYAMARSIFYRENSSKIYSQFCFASSLVVAEMPYSILCAIVFWAPLYWMPGFSSLSSRAGHAFATVLTTEVFSVTMGQAIQALTPSPYIAVLANPFIVVTLSLLAGVVVPPLQMPGFYRSWLYEIDPFTRLIAGMAVTEISGLQITCRPEELNRFTAPLGETCASYMADFFSRGGTGYLVNGTTSNCEFCAYSVGDEFLAEMGMSWENRWRDLGIFICFVASNLVILFAASRFLNYNKR